MLTYWCPSRCACCYVFSGPAAGSDDTEMSADFALDCWRSVGALAGANAKIHITGGEPFGRYGRLKDILVRAALKKDRPEQNGLCRLEKIETNAGWCEDQTQVRQRFQELTALGVRKVQISTDIYHQEYVPIERVRLAARIGAEVLGPDGIQVRWRDFLENPVNLAELAGPQRRSAMAAALAHRSERLLGRAANELANLFELKHLDDFVEMNCRPNLLGARHVHVDGAGNVFIGTCIGIIAANIKESRMSLDQIWRKFDPREHPIIAVLIEHGPAGLLEPAKEFGYQPLENGYASKCHLCYELRRFLYKNKAFGSALGPRQCYGLCEK